MLWSESNVRKIPCSLLLHIVKLRVKVVCLNDERGLYDVNEAARKILRVVTI